MGAPAAQQVFWSARPASAVRFDTLSQLPAGAYTRITLLEPGPVEITATADGKVATVNLSVPPVLRATEALVVQQFALHRVADLIDRGFVMPLLTLREPTGRKGVDVIGVSVTVPTAPPLLFCVTSRTWQQGMTADAFGMSYGEPEFGFGRSRIATSRSVRSNWCSLSEPRKAQSGQNFQPASVEQTRDRRVRRTWWSLRMTPLRVQRPNRRRHPPMRMQQILGEETIGLDDLRDASRPAGLVTCTDTIPAVTIEVFRE